VNQLRCYRDDGPLVEALSRALPDRASCLPWTAVALLPTFAVLTAPQGSTGLWLCSAVLAAALASACCFDSPHQGRLDWLAPPLLRLSEYSALIALTVSAAPEWMPACYALLAAVAYHHYDIVYRLRDRRQKPNETVRRVGLGWDGRLFVAGAAEAAGLLGPVLAGAAGALLAFYVVEGARAWRRAPGDAV
jgi:hypothetical protein